MSIRDVSRAPRLPRRDMPRHELVHNDLLQQAMSRRRFIGAVGAASAVGAVLGTRLLSPKAVAADPDRGDGDRDENRDRDGDGGIGQVLPISGGSSVIENAFGKLFHVYGPPTADSPDSDASTVGNFKGDVGLAYISGTVTETNRKTRARRELPFADSDMRFMKGVFRGRDGHVRDGTFALI